MEKPEEDCSFSRGLSDVDFLDRCSSTIFSVASFVGSRFEDRSSADRNCPSPIWPVCDRWKDPRNETRRANEQTCSCVFFVACLTSRFRLKFIRCAVESRHVQPRQSWGRWKAVVQRGRRLENSSSVRNLAGGSSFVTLTSAGTTNQPRRPRDTRYTFDYFF